LPRSETHFGDNVIPQLGKRDFASVGVTPHTFYFDAWVTGGLGGTFTTGILGGTGNGGRGRIIWRRRAVAAVFG